MGMIPANSNLPASVSDWKTEIIRMMGNALLEVQAEGDVKSAVIASNALKEGRRMAEAALRGAKKA
jgi:hypothetical protein